jgi:hypothetical protein
VRQYPGDVVFIPAYCAHQVANMADAIKIACDFCSMTNLSRTERIVGELREQRLSDSEGDDVLQFYLTLWYTWLGLSRLAKTSSGENVSHDSFRELDSLTDITVYPNQTNLSFVPTDAPSPIPEYPSMCAAGPGEDLFPPVKGVTRQEIRRQKARDRKKFRKGKLAVYVPGHIWHCPFRTCSRRFNRSGLFDHL